jgi:L-alanine-DL-glutamate epimerase-like enolase superfamily enzyme
VYELLGGTPRAVRAYAASMRRDITAEEEAERLSSLRDRHGFEAFKIRIGKECGHDEDEWPGRTEAVVERVRSALGDDAALLVDANSCYTPARAIDVGQMLELHGVSHFEEPCPYWELDWTREVTEALDLDVTGGEQDWDLGVWRRMTATRAVDVVQPDVCYVGGLTRALRVAALAEAAGLPCTPHSANHSLVLVFTLHLLASIANAGPYVELSIEPDDDYPWQAGMYEPRPRVVDGSVEVPSAPGWGVDISAEWLSRCEHRVSRSE